MVAMRPQRQRRILSSAGLCLLLPAQALRGEPAGLRLGVDTNNQSGLSMASRAVLERAYRKLGLSLQFEPLPLRRSLRMAASGEIEGEAHRMAEIADHTPGLLKVPVAINRLEVRAYTRAPRLAPVRWSELQQLRVSFQRGSMSVESRLPEVRKVESRDLEEAIRQLRMDMSDVALLTQPANPNQIHESLVRGLTMSAEPLDVIPLFHVLHERHAELLPRLAAVLQALEASGESARLRAEAVRGP